MPRKKKTKTVLITGVANQWGSRLATRLCDTPGLRVIGIDAHPPKKEIKNLDFIQADIRNPLLLELLQLEKVDTVCHLAFIESYRRTESAFDHNVIGTMKFMGACAEAGVRKVVFKSSTRVYGASPRNPAFLREERPVHGSRQYGYNRDNLEIESFFNGFRRQYPKITLTILRFPGIIGPDVNTPLVRFLSDSKAPILLGFDPMMQVIHQEDVLAALMHTIQEDYPGVYNVAAEGILPLTKILAIVGKIPLPVLHPAAYWAVSAGGPLARHFPIEPDYLRYRWVADTQRMHEVLGFMPQYTAEEALREFAGQQRMRRYMPEAASRTYDEERLRDIIERRRRTYAARQSKGA
ncbi:MAG: NAD-dependent epimerase/dehydratase family protein [Anaerolineae bacterium]|nr:MAG: NAD-dependent epimerase/dehydratase family protein [Anaerolineae bacterium]